MKSRTHIFFALLALVPAIGSAHGYCDELRALLTREEPDFDELDRLKARCDYELRQGEVARLLAVFKKTNLSEAYQLAHANRAKGYTRLLSEANETIKAFLQPSDGGNLPLKDDSFFAESLQHLASVKSEINSMNTLALDDYLGGEVYNAIHDVLNLTDLQVGVAAIDELKRQRLDAIQRSDAEIARLQQSLAQLLQASIQRISAHRVAAKLAAAEMVKDEFLKDLSPELLALKALTSWGRFLAETKANLALADVDQKIRSGLIQSAKERADLIAELADTFLKHLPLGLSKKIKESASYAQFTSNLLRLNKTLLTMTTAESLQRMSSLVRQRSEKLHDLKSVCLGKYPEMSERWKELDAVTVQVTTSLPVNTQPESKAYFYESLANRLAVFNDLCRGLTP